MADETAGTHPGTATLRELAARRLGKARAGGVVMHLVRCTPCRERLRKMAGGRELLEEVFGADADRVPRLTPEEAVDAHVAVQVVLEIRSHDPALWPVLARRDPRFGSLAIVAQLLLVAQEEYHRALDVADGASAAALAALERWHPADAPTPEALYMGARAWAVRATVLRLTSRLREAERAIARAWSFAERLGRDRRLESFLCMLEGGVRRDAGAYSTAIDLFRRAGILATLSGDEATVARAATLVAFCYNDCGDPAKAAETLEQIRSGLDEIPKSGRLKMVVAINLAIAYARLGRTWEARLLLPEIERRMEEVGEPLSTVRTSWLRGMIHQENGEAAHAERFYRQVQTAFVEAGVPQDVALVSLDLAVLYLETDRPAQAAGVATWLVPVFRDLGIEKETLAAGLLLLRALERQQATVDAVRDYAKKLQQSPAWAG